MHNSNRVFVAACLGMLLFGIALISLGSILPQIVEKYQVDELAAGTLATLLPLGILIGSLVFGPIADRYGYKGLLIVACLLVMAGFELIAFGDGWTWIQISVLLVGLGGGALNGATNAVVADISEGDRGSRLSLLGVFFGVGALGMPMILALLLPIYELEAILAGIGGFIFLVSLYLVFTRFPRPKQAQGFPIKEGLRLLQDRVMLVLGLVLFFQSGTEALINNWTTSYLNAELDISIHHALLALTVHVAALTAMRLALGFLLRRQSLIRVLIGSLVIMMGGSVLLASAQSYPLVLVALALLGIGFAGVFPIILARVGDLWTELSGTAFSIALVIAVSGNMLINYLTGVAASKYGLGLLPLLIIGCVTCLLLISIYIRPLLRTTPT